MSLPAPGQALPAPEPLRRHGNIPSLEPLPAPALLALPGRAQEPGCGSHHLALQRMAGDLLSLRRRVASLEAENAQLRHSLARHREAEQLCGTDTDTLTRDELRDRLATLSRELAAGAAELRARRAREQRLQNELIRVGPRGHRGLPRARAVPGTPGPLSPQKNDREQELLLLQRRRQRDKVIEAMERLLRDRSAERAAGATLAALLAPKREEPPGAARLRGAREKLELLARLEEAQGRARALERQEAARSRAREQQELGTRLRERGLALVSRGQGTAVAPETCSDLQ
ncbi:coiled-coil domain-containing protein 33 isoform X2 [Passer domesticus]|uniref:coiled-coil domain-containing protein 33 isoform X2 n=1 Tax=Passer domesticus TaxID=48849 RepID=UPI0030FED45C